MDTELIESLRQKHRDCMAKAKRCDELHQRAKRRLASFPLACRLYNWRRFTKLRARIDALKWYRFAYVATAMNLVRNIKLAGGMKSCTNSTSAASS